MVAAYASPKPATFTLLGDGTLAGHSTLLPNATGSLLVPNDDRECCRARPRARSRRLGGGCGLGLPLRHVAISGESRGGTAACSALLWPTSGVPSVLQELKDAATGWVSMHHIDDRPADLGAVLPASGPAPSPSARSSCPGGAAAPSPAPRGSAGSPPPGSPGAALAAGLCSVWVDWSSLRWTRMDSAAGSVSHPAARSPRKYSARDSPGLRWTRVDLCRCVQMSYGASWRIH